MQVSGRRALLGFAAGAVAVAGVLTALAAADGPPVLALVPSAEATCLAAGPYQAPRPGSVGLPPGTGLCHSGPLTITRAGTVLDGWDVRGGIVVAAPDVVVRRSRITGDGSMPYGVTTTPSGSVRIEDSTLTGDFPRAALGENRWSAERVEITRVTGDGAHLGQRARLCNSTVHDLEPGPGVHPDAVVVSGAAGDVLVQDSIVQGAPDTGSAVHLDPRPGGGPVVLRGNTLGGGRWTLRQDADAAGEVWISGNRFRRDFAERPLQVPPGPVVVGNSFVDGGLLPPA